MLKYLKSLFAGLFKTDDEPSRPPSPREELVGLIEVDEPMAGAGALLSGTHIKSETEKALERASRHDES